MMAIWMATGSPSKVLSNLRYLFFSCAQCQNESAETRCACDAVYQNIRAIPSARKLHDFSLSMTHNSHSPARDSDETLYSTG